jgi:hypothetical protein
MYRRVAVKSPLHAQMRDVDVLEIHVDTRGRLLVIPAGTNRGRKFMYRTASGVRWDETSKAFVAAEPASWQHGEFLAHMLREVRGELRENLRLTANTRWVNVSADLRNELSSILTKN